MQTLLTAQVADISKDDRPLPTKELQYKCATQAKPYRYKNARLIKIIMQYLFL